MCLWGEVIPPRYGVAGILDGLKSALTVLQVSKFISISGLLCIIYETNVAPVDIYQEGERESGSVRH